MNLRTLNIGLMKSGRAQWQKAEETRKIFNVVLIHQDKIFFTSELFKVIQDAISLILHYRTLCLFRTISSSTFCHIGCAINLHSIMNSRLIPGGQNLSKRQTVFFTSVDRMNKEHTDPDTVDLKAPRLARCLQTAWKKHQNAVCWVDIKLAQKKGFEFYQTRSNAIILYNTLPAYCIPKAIKMETGEIIFEKVYASPRPPPKISFQENWMQELGSEVAGLGENFQQTQTQPKTTNPIVRTGRPVSTEQPSSSSAQEIDKRLLLGCENTIERTWRPVKKLCGSVRWTFRWRQRRRRKRRRRSGLNGATRWKWTIYRFVHTTWGNRHRLQSVWIATCSCETSRKLPCSRTVKKIESHPHRPALQADLQQSNAYNQFSEKSKKMIRDMGNVELFELCETIPKVQCSECLLYWNQGIVYCTCGHLLRESESSRHLHQWRLDALSIPNYVIKKVRPRGARHGKTETQEEHL